jgi:hypothetical protein
VVGSIGNGELRSQKIYSVNLLLCGFLVEMAGMKIYQEVNRKHELAMN